MELVPPGISLPFEATFDIGSLPVAMSVYDTTTGTAVLVIGPAAMTNPLDASYVGYFTPVVDHSYLIFKAVYTDGTFTALNTNYYQSTETIIAQNIGGGGSGMSTMCPIVGVINGGNPSEPTLNGCCVPNLFSIFQGDAKIMPMKLVYAGAFGNPFDLTNCTAIVVSLLNADGTIAHLTLASSAVAITSPAVLGQFTVAISSVVSALLNAGELQSVDVTFTISGSPMTVRFYNALSVFQVA